MLTNKSTNYALTIPVLGPVPAGSVITSVNYSWNLSTLPSGLTVSLCHDTTATCVNVTSSKNGSVSNFNGLDANKKFIYVFRVSGSGSIFPVAYGMSDQVIVNYN
ncbi:flagellar protein FlhE [Cellvibrio mixtus]|uniref:flagellar protein FlhE n=1 Tax=Cellvibrio mixtus TaxID=39650 RepID=UPI0039961DB2